MVEGTAQRLDELPPTPGSVVSANVEQWGKVRRRLLMRRAYEPNPWVSQQDVSDRAYWADTDLRDVVVVFDAADDLDSLRGQADALQAAEDESLKLESSLTSSCQATIRALKRAIAAEAEQAALSRYAAALARGLSDAEARAEGWPVAALGVGAPTGEAPTTVYGRLVKTAEEYRSLPDSVKPVITYPPRPGPVTSEDPPKEQQ